MIDAHEAGFLEDIRANPDDDAPRLIYADWLEEQGASAERPDALERAEFIRGQGRLGSMRWYHPDWRKLTDRCRELLGICHEVPRPKTKRQRKQRFAQVYNNDAWKSPMPPWVASAGYSRGFLSAVSIAGANLLQLLTAP